MRKAEKPIVIALALIAAFCVKQYYSTASAAELSWILKPTTFLVELFTRYRFTTIADGYVNHELRFVIAPACAGINFLLAAWMALVLTRPQLAWLVPHALLAYATALGANALRITLAILFPTTPMLHRIEGAVVYLALLFALFTTVRRKAWAIPLACYLGITVVIPLLNGGWQRPAFWLHAAVVVVIAIVAALVMRMRTPIDTRPAPTATQSLRL